VAQVRFVDQGCRLDLASIALTLVGFQAMVRLLARSGKPVWQASARSPNNRHGDRIIILAIHQHRVTDDSLSYKTELFVKRDCATVIGSHVELDARESPIKRQLQRCAEESLSNSTPAMTRNDPDPEDSAMEVGREELMPMDVAPSHDLVAGESDEHRIASLD
jgi:hypothetical protein